MSIFIIYDFTFQLIYFFQHFSADSRDATSTPVDNKHVGQKIGVFDSRNFTLVKAHIGSTAKLPCRVKKGVPFGMVRTVKDVMRVNSIKSVLALMQLL